MVIAPQPLGPSGSMDRGLQTTTGTQDVDSIPFPSQRMNMHEVPFCFDFHVAGSTISKLRLTHQPSANLPEYTAKQAPSLPDSYSKRAECQDFVARHKDDGIPFEIDGPICNVKTDIAVRQSKWLEDQEIGKRFAPLWQQSSKFSSLKEMIQVPSMSRHSTYGHKLSVSRIAETAWENQCSNLLHLDTDRCLLSLLLICVFLVFVMVCCNRSSHGNWTSGQSCAKFLCQSCRLCTGENILDLCFVTQPWDVTIEPLVLYPHVEWIWISIPCLPWWQMIWASRSGPISV